ETEILRYGGVHDAPVTKLRKIERYVLVLGTVVDFQQRAGGGADRFAIAIPSQQDVIARPLHPQRQASWTRRGSWRRDSLLQDRRAEITDRKDKHRCNPQLQNEGLEPTRLRRFRSSGRRWLGGDHRGRKRQLRRALRDYRFWRWGRHGRLGLRLL